MDLGDKPFRIAVSSLLKKSKVIMKSLSNREGKSIGKQKLYLKTRNF